MKTEFEKMRSGELYSFADEEVMSSIKRAKALCARIRQMSEFDNGYRETLEQLILGLPKSATIVSPIACDHGSGLRLGENVFINGGCTFLDGGFITIGDNTKVGPDCHFYTPHHPIDFVQRRQDVEWELPITIGKDCWIGGGTTICPGVTIGDRVIVGAGSVVVHDVPDDVMVAGNPATVKKSLKKE